MFKTYLKSFIFVFLFSALIIPVFAGNNVLTKIGTMDLSGNAYSEWWYTQENPTLSGVAAAGATVNIDINGTKSQATADASGNWSFTPSTLTTGEHSVTISTGGETYAFTLHAGEELPEGVGGGGETSDVPATGFNQIYGVALGVIFLSAGYVMLKRWNVTKEFEKKILRDFS